METEKFLYESKEFASLQEMSESLLHEANQQIIRIDMGELPNTAEVRNYIKWRLLHLQYHFNDKIPHELRTTYNSL
ncbi:hypothetical protein [Aneurinibacillus terranovensis]|uniref:hypothetical protein n=1 Tax=Aneurinibacillus terranovensis TaxID=278991 RepID=UPI000419EE85|nr:hypothetical protein [Aneurinibacillus terranovensis]